jgi:hypothetical protein
MMVMVDYPYESNFVAPLPAWPVNYSCAEASKAKYEHKYYELPNLYGIAAAGNTYFNFAGQI